MIKYSILSRDLLRCIGKHAIPDLCLFLLVFKLIVYFEFRFNYNVNLFVLECSDDCQEYLELYIT